MRGKLASCQVGALWFLTVLRTACVLRERSTVSPLGDLTQAKMA